MTAFFLSYARADEITALRLADDLIAAGVAVWVDQYDIRPSQHWDREVEAAVRRCDGMIVVLSPRSVASPNVADEVSVAIDDKKTVIPVLIEACTLPLRMTRMQFIDASRDYDAALRRCLAEMGLGVARPSAPAAPVATPLAPEVLNEAEQRLTGLIGPIAAVLVRQAGARAASKADLYAELARSVPHEADRKRFLAGSGDAPAPQPPPPAQEPPEDIGLDDAALEALTLALTHHLGPIAGPLVRRERPLAASRHDLCERLAARIPSDRDRAAFLKAVARL